MTKWVIIVGANGALGRSVARKFAQASWNAILCDVTAPHPPADRFIQLNSGAELGSQFEQLESGVISHLKSVSSVDAIVNVGGGFRMDDASSPELFANLELMYSSSVGTSMLSAHLAARFLAKNGLLVLPGAAGAVSGTPWALSYGAMKAAVHQMVKSLSSKGSGLADNTRVVGIAPVMLDTPANRSAMPDADFASWTPLEDVSSRLVAWAERKEEVVTGSIYKISTASGKTSFAPF
jgi:dihydropteridine reductase